MFWLILGIVILIAGIAFGLACFGEESKGAGTTCIIGGIVLSILFVCLSCVTSVPTGNTGIVTTFGRVENYVLDAGLSMKAPCSIRTVPLAL